MSRYQYEAVICRGYDPYPVAMRYIQADTLEQAGAMADAMCLPGEHVTELNFVKDAATDHV